MKRLFLALTLCCAALGLRAQESIQPYLPAEAMPDLIRCLPAPPDSLSPAFSYDIQRYFWGKEQRNDPARADIARRDAVWSYEALLAELSVPFGMTLSPETTPEIWKLVTTGLATTDPMRVAPKAFYNRRRPFAKFNEAPMMADDVQFSGEGSYPSGHTLRSWTAALILAEVNPAAAEALFKRAWEVGESRVISGAHWQSDVDVTRLGASIGYSALQTSPAYQEQVTRAQREYRRLSGTASFEDAFVAIGEFIPDVILEIRYYSTFNFVGARVDGYEDPVALLTKEAAVALKAVNDELLAKGYRLKIYDAYRPQRAVDHFVRWAENIPDTLTRAYFYPDLDKSVLFDQQYIMKRSGHTRGSTVDLTLFDMATGKDVDMGGTFDWFGPESHPDFCGNPKTGKYTGNNRKSPKGRSITAEQFENRMILRRAMLKHGFKPIDSEWWHFTLKNEPYPDTYFDEPVRQRD